MSHSRHVTRPVAATPVTDHRSIDPPTRAGGPAGRLQRNLGNRRTQAVVQAMAAGDCPGDRWEQEADRAAAAALGPDPVPMALSPVRPEAGVGGPMSSDLVAAVSGLGSGIPVPADSRRRMETVSGVGLGGVRLHVGAASDRLNAEAGSKALTVGRDVLVRSDQYRPGTALGESVLQHELAHVAQQSAPGAGPVVQRLVDPHRAPLGFRAWRRKKSRKDGAGDGKVENISPMRAKVRLFEARVGAYYFNKQETADAVSEALKRLREVLTQLNGQHSPSPGGVTDAVADTPQAKADRAFVRDEPGSAGQVGSGVEFETLLTGNVRELTTAFYNAAYFNARKPPQKLPAQGVDSPKGKGKGGEQRVTTLSMMLMERLRDNPQALKDAGLDPDEVDRVRRNLSWFSRDPFKIGTVVNLSKAAWYHWLTFGFSTFWRRRYAAGDQAAAPRTVQYYEDAQVPLGLLEREFALKHSPTAQSDNPELPWREGSIYWRPISNRWAAWVKSGGFSVQTGISATTAKMLNAARLVGLSESKLIWFLGGLMAWMLPGRDHTLFEIQRGAGMARLRLGGHDPSSSSYSFVDSYQNLPGMDTIADIRKNIGPLPHEELHDEAIRDRDVVDHEARWAQELLEEFQDYIDDPKFGRATQEFEAAEAERAKVNKKSDELTDPNDPDTRSNKAYERLERAKEGGDQDEIREAEEELRLANEEISTVQFASLKAANESSRKASRLEVRKLRAAAIERLRRESGQDPTKVLTDRQRMAVATWSGTMFPLMNTAIRQRRSWNPIRRAIWAVAYRKKVAELAAAGRAEDEKGYGVKMPHMLASENFQKAKKIETELARLKGSFAQEEIDERSAEIERLWNDYDKELPSLKKKLNQEVDIQTDMFYDALQHLPKVGTPESPVYVYRGEKSAGLAGWWNKRKWQGTRRVSEFLAFSRKESVADEFRDNPGLLIVVKLIGKYARDISPFVAKVAEDEVVIPPGARLAPVRDDELKKDGAVVYTEV